METTIDANTKISQLLRFDRELVISTLVNLNSKFSKLRNPILRNLLVKRVSIADACKISQTPLADFLRSMEQIGFKVTTTAGAVASDVSADIAFVDRPDYLELDVRPILALHKDPLKEILATVKLLEAEQGLKLINTFEPLPLIHLLAEKGFAYRVVHEAPDVVITYFNGPVQNSGRQEMPVVATPIIDAGLFDQAMALFSPEQLTTIDVRALEMPKPMLSILERTPMLARDEALFVYHKKIPVYLLPELEKQGLTYLFKNIGPGNVHMLIFYP